MGKGRAWRAVWIVALVTFALANAGTARSQEGAALTWEETGLRFSSVPVSTSRDGAVIAWNGSELLRSTDAGTTWTRAPAPERQFMSFGLDADRHDSNRIFVGNRQALFRTLDGGASWATVLEVSPADETKDESGRVVRNVYDHVGDIAISPADPTLVYASIRSIVWTATVRGGGAYTLIGLRTMRSRDGGETWDEVDRARGAEGCRLESAVLYPHPSDPQRVFTKRQCQPGDPSENGLAISEDQGATWRQIDPIPGANVARVVGGWPALPSRLYVQVHDANQGERLNVPDLLYRSDDSGLTWQPITLSPPPDLPLEQAQFSGFVQHPTDVNRIWLLLEPKLEIVAREAPSHLLESVDGGDTWTRQALPTENGSPRLIAVSADGRYLFGTATRQGLVRARLP